MDPKTDPGGKGPTSLLPGIVWMLASVAMFSAQASGSAYLQWAGTMKVGPGGLHHFLWFMAVVIALAVGGIVQLTRAQVRNWKVAALVLSYLLMAVYLLLLSGALM